ncbi:MAG: PHB depolymerase family esterase [Polyangiales bacterium]
MSTPTTGAPVAGAREVPRAGATAVMGDQAGSAPAPAAPGVAGAVAGAPTAPGSVVGGSSGAAGATAAAGSGGADPSAVDAGIPVADAGVVPQTCASAQPEPGERTAMLEHGGRMRRYLLHVPPGLPASPVPLVLDFHGNGSSARQEASGSGWAEKADAKGFVVAYPDGVGGGWNVGNCCGEALAEKIDDVGFAKALVTALSSEACIDPRRVYATGISNGAGLSHRLACEAADVFAAIAAASADLVTDPCTPARPISELSVRGLDDTLVAYAGGNTGSTGWYSPGAKGTLDLWKTIDMCTGAVDTTSREHCETYASCAAGVEITLCSLPGTGHILYNNSLDFSVPDVAWEMFERQPMR